MEGPFGDHAADQLGLSRHGHHPSRRRDLSHDGGGQAAKNEDYWMGKATERLFLPLLRLFLGGVGRITILPAEGVFHNLIIVSIKKRFPGHPQKVVFWGLGLMMLTKAIVVVDETVNVHDLQEVAWRVLGNVIGNADITLVDGAVDQLDHSSVRDSFGGKIGIDATAKGPMDGHSRGWPTGR